MVEPIDKHSNAIDFAEWMVKQGYHVDRMLNGEIYWFKWHKASQMPCGTTQEIYQIYCKCP